MHTGCGEEYWLAVRGGGGDFDDRHVYQWTAGGGR